MTAQQATSLLAESAPLFRSGALEVDLSGVSEADTVALSLLLEWMRQAQAHNCSLTFTHLPENLASLATLYGILDLIPHSAH